MLKLNKRYKERYGFRTKVRYDTVYEGYPNEEMVRALSREKGEVGEHEWIQKFRLKALKYFLQKPMPNWGPDLSGIDFENIVYYARPEVDRAKTWEELPKKIREVYERLNIPEVEKKYLLGLSAQFDSEIVLRRIKEDLKKLGVIFTDPEDGLKNYPIFKKWFGKIVPPNDNKFAALNSAFFSGGSFIYVPPGVKVPYPLETYFRINISRAGQFERTLIIADEGAEVTYVEGCTAPVYSKSSLHAAVVEIVALPGAKVRYVTLQNWSKNVYNLVTKRSVAFENATVEWLDSNIGSKITMKYPSVYMRGENAKAEIISVAYAGKGQIQDTGAKAVHLAKNTTSKIVAKSVSAEGGEANYRGLISIAKEATRSKAIAKCDALLIDEKSRTNTYPYTNVQNQESSVAHEAFVGKLSQEKLFYLMSRGLDEDQAISLVVSGFFSDFIRRLPLQYAIEFKRLIELEIKGGVG